MKKRFIHACYVLLAFVATIGSSFSQSQEQRQTETQLAKYRKAHPTLDLQKAWAKGDLRFVGVYGISLTTPGVEVGKDEGFIHLVGINPIEGTSDGISSSAQTELNEVGIRYATKYNTLLFKRLRAHRKTNPVLRRLFAGIEQELKDFEHANPRQDFVRNIKKKDFRFLYLYDTGIEGVRDVDFDSLKPYELVLRELKGDKVLFTGAQYRRLQRITVNYIRPYNKMLSSYLEKHSKLRK